MFECAFFDGWCGFSEERFYSRLAAPESQSGVGHFDGRLGDMGGVGGSLVVAIASLVGLPQILGRSLRVRDAKILPVLTLGPTLTESRDGCELHFFLASMSTIQ